MIVPIIVAFIVLSALTHVHFFFFWLIWPLAFFTFGRFRRRHGPWRMVP